LVRKIFSIALVLITITISQQIAAQEIKLPKFYANVTLQYEKFDGDYFNSFAGYNMPANKFSIRHATIGAFGTIGEYVEYNIEAGSATCLAAGQFTLMDASVFYKPYDYLRLGIMKGEILRGFELSDECVEVLTAEKPRFATTFAPCHPLGAVVEFDYNFSGSMGLASQLAYLNGNVTQNLDNEYDCNVGLIFRTPYPGLSIGGFYNSIKTDYGPDTNFKIINEKGQRMGFGINFDANNIFLRGEYYLLKGYYNDPFRGTLYENSDSTKYIESKDLEMNAFYLEGGYTFNTNLKPIPFIEPYIRYQYWDKASNAYGDHLYSYLTVGLTLFLDEEKQTLFRIDYEPPLTTPDNAEKDAKLLIVRFQTEIN
jgi:hypothetical protein